MLNKIFLLLSLLFLLYLVLPGPDSIEDFPALPNSTRSTLDGDTWQVGNNKAYFSDDFRNQVVPYIREAYRQKTFFLFPPLRLNYPPEFAYTAIKIQTESTYLEELVYPLRDSLYTNGMEQFYANGQPVYPGATKFEVNGREFDSKVTIRFYPSPLWARILSWIGINLAVVALWRMGKKVFNG